MDDGAIGLHTKHSQVRIVTAEGTVVFERRIMTRRDQFATVFGGRDGMRILFESSTESEWVASAWRAWAMRSSWPIGGLLRTPSTAEKRTESNQAHLWLRVPSIGNPCHAQAGAQGFRCRRPRPQRCKMCLERRANRPRRGVFRICAGGSTG